MPYEWVPEAPEQDADVALWCYRFSICDGGTGSELLMWNGCGIWFGWDKLRIRSKAELMKPGRQGTFCRGQAGGCACYRASYLADALVP